MHRMTSYKSRVLSVGILHFPTLLIRIVMTLNQSMKLTSN